MKKIHVAAFLFLMGVSTGFSQSVSWKYTSDGLGPGGVEQAFAVTQTKDTGYLVAGRTRPVGINAGDLYIVKLNAAGEKQWSKTYVGRSIDEIRGVHQLADGSYVMTGVTVDFPDTTGSLADAQQLLVMKLDAQGDTVWVKRYGGPNSDTGDGMDTTGTGYIIAGRYGLANSTNDYYLVRIDGNGDTLWTKTYGGASTDIARAVKHTHDNGYIMVGTTRSFGPDAATGNIWLVKTDENGDTLWTKVFGDAGEQEAFGLSLTTDGGYIIAGRSGSTLGGESDIYVIKTDEDGNEEWSKMYSDANGNDVARAVIQTGSGYAVSGYRATSSDFNPPLFYISKLDTAGTVVWDTAIGNSDSPNGAKAYAMQQTSDGGLIVTGENDLGVSGADVRLLTVKLVNFAPLITIPSALLPEMAIDPCLVYPNPFSVYTTMVVPAGIGNASLQIYNSTGQVVLNAAINANQQSLTISNTDLPKGIYFYHLSGKTGNIYRGKLIAQ